MPSLKQRLSELPITSFRSPFSISVSISAPAADADCTVLSFSFSFSLPSSSNSASVFGHSRGSDSEPQLKLQNSRQRFKSHFLKSTHPDTDTLGRLLYLHFLIVSLDAHSDPSSSNSLNLLSGDLPLRTYLLSTLDLSALEPSQYSLVVYFINRVVNDSLSICTRFINQLRYLDATATASDAVNTVVDPEQRVCLQFRVLWPSACPYPIVATPISNRVRSLLADPNFLSLKSQVESPKPCDPNALRSQSTQVPQPLAAKGHLSIEVASRDSLPPAGPHDPNCFIGALSGPPTFWPSSTLGDQARQLSSPHHFHGEAEAISCVSQRLASAETSADSIVHVSQQVANTEPSNVSQQVATARTSDRLGRQVAAPISVRTTAQRTSISDASAYRQSDCYTDDTPVVKQSHHCTYSSAQSFCEAQSESRDESHDGYNRSFNNSLQASSTRASFFLDCAPLKALMAACTLSRVLEAFKFFGTLDADTVHSVLLIVAIFSSLFALILGIRRSRLQSLEPSRGYSYNGEENSVTRVTLGEQTRLTSATVVEDNSATRATLGMMPPRQACSTLSDANGN